MNNTPHGKRERDRRRTADYLKRLREPCPNHNIRKKRARAGKGWKRRIYAALAAAYPSAVIST